MAPGELVRDAVERVVLSGHVGKSGAGLERVRLAPDAVRPLADQGVELLAALMRLGWKKALDAVEHLNAEIRERERADLDWWVARARGAPEAGDLRWT